MRWWSGMWPLRLLYGIWLGREEAADDWHLPIFVQVSTGHGGQTRKKYKGMHIEQKSSWNLVIMQWWSRILRGIDFWLNCWPIAFMRRSELISNNKNVQNTSFNRRQKTRHGLFFGARRARLPCPSCCKTVFHDVGRSSESIRKLWVFPKIVVPPNHPF